MSHQVPFNEQSCVISFLSLPHFYCACIIMRGHDVRLLIYFSLLTVGAGSVYVYRSDGGNWSVISNENRRKLVAKNGMEYDLFGSSVAVSSDTGLILVGAPNKRKSGFSRAGALYFISADEINFINDDDIQQDKTHHYVKKSLFSLALLGVALPLTLFWCWPKPESIIAQRSSPALPREAQDEEDVVTPLREGQYFAFDSLSKTIQLMSQEKE